MKNSAAFICMLAIVFAAGFAVLAATLWRVQVRGAAGWKQNQDVQITRRVRTVGARGRILDCEGRVLAECRAARNAVLRPEAFAGAGGKVKKRVAAAMETVKKLASALGRDVPFADDAIERHFMRSSVLPLTIFRDLDDRELAIVAEHGMDMPGIDIENECARTYPFGALACHVIGYTGSEIPSVGGEERLRNYHFVMPELRGRAGIEAYYDGYLRGAPGERLLNVNALGYATEKAGGLAAASDRAAGPDLHLTLDAKVQNALEKELEGVTGAGVVLACKDGAVVAMASSPKYDLNDLVPVLRGETYCALTNNPAKPLVNRALGGLYEPGSTFKPITALAAWRAGIDPDALYECKGIYKKTHCWDRWGHGFIGLKNAIEYSCNTYFLHLADIAGGTNVCAQARDFGLGRKTGIDLYGEAVGGVEPWMLQAAIGQGKVQVTPLQMAVVTVALATGGKIVTPHLKKREGEGNGAMPRMAKFPLKDYETVRMGLWAVTQTGTGRRIRTRTDENGKRHQLAVSCAGKTGTAERGTGEKRTKNTWAIAFAPYDKPEVAVALVVERGESGGTTAAPRVHTVLAAIFGEREEGR